MKLSRFVAAAAVLLLFTGCDQNAFTEDYPDPGTEGLPPYVAFDASTFNTRGYNLTAEGTVANIVRRANAPNTATLVENITLPVRLPMALEETVTVQFTVETTASPETQYRLQIPVMDDEGDEVYVDHAATGSATFNIIYDIENLSSYFTELRLQLRAIAGVPACEHEEFSVRVQLTDASVPSGRDLMIGRMPGLTDQVITVNSVRPACP